MREGESTVMNGWINGIREVFNNDHFLILVVKDREGLALLAYSYQPSLAVIPPEKRPSLYSIVIFVIDLIGRVTAALQCDSITTDEQRWG